MLTTANSAIDIETFNLLKDLMDDEGFEEIIDFFCTDTDQALKNIRMAIKKGQVDYIECACHKLKSSSKLIGALRLAELSTKLEQVQQLNAATPGAADRLLQQLEQEFSLTRQWLAETGITARC